MSLQDKLNQAEQSEHSGGSSNWFKVKEGVNKLRILSEPEVMFEDFKMGICYHECGYTGNAKYLAYVLDRADNKVKLYKIPYGIFQTIAKLESDEDYSFEGFPMPFDIKISAVNAGTKEVKYTVLPGPVSRIDDEVLEVLSKQKPAKDIIDIFQAKNLEKHRMDGTWEKEQARREALGKELDEGRKAFENKSSDEEDINPEDIPF